MYRLYVNSMSPYSSKAAAAIGYAGIACELKTQHMIDRYAVLKRLTGKTLVPTLRRGEWAIHDSTRILRYVRGETDQPLLPADPALGPLCWLLEDFADEWIALWVLWSRWAHEADAEKNAEEIGREVAAGLPLIWRPLGKLASSGIKNKVERGGARDANAPALQRSRDRFLQSLETLLEDEPEFLFEAYPTVADFSVYGQLVQYRRDPTGSEELRLYPNVREYLDRLGSMELPHAHNRSHRGPARQVSALAPLIAEFLGTYWRVLIANHRAYHREEPPASVEVELLDGEVFHLRPSRYWLGRLEFVLSQLDQAYAEREELFGGKGLELEHALVSQVARLTDYQAGRELLREFPHIGRPE